MVQHPVLQNRVRAAAKASGLQVVEVTALDESPSDAAQNAIGATGGVPTAIVVELERVGMVEAIGEWKQRWPDCFVAASIALPDQERWIAAEAAGCDLVANRGSLARQLAKKLEALRGGESMTRRKERLLAKKVTHSGDGLIGRVPDAPDGVIAIFRIGERICAIRDVCPHASVSLADGEVEDGIITCPAHGSRFDICSGERLRGPSDYPIQTYSALYDGDELYVEI